MGQFKQKINNFDGRLIPGYEEAFKIQWFVFDNSVISSDQLKSYNECLPEEFSTMSSIKHGDFICPKSLKPVKKYNPLTIENLYLIFLGLGSDSKSILNFVNKYGFLWIVKKPEKNNKIHLSLFDFGAATQRIFQEVIKLRHLKDLYEAIQEDNYELITRKFKDAGEGLLGIKNIEKVNSNKAVSETKEKELRSYAKLFLTTQINYVLKDTCTVIVPSEDGYKTSFRCRSLLAAIYLQFAWHTSEEKSFRFCKNEKCKALFAPSREKQVFCKKSCKNAHNARASIKRNS